MSKIAVVGAGPAGLLTSIFIEKHDVTIYEDHREVGKPKHCAGFVSYDTASRYASLTGWSIIDHKYSTIVFHTPRGVHELYFKNPIICHVNRPLLEEKLLDKALSRGHEIIFGKKAKPGNAPNKIVVDGVEKTYEKVVAADGPLSVFRRRYYGGLNKYLVGIQYIYRASGVDTGKVHTLFNNLTPGFFQWLAPIDRDTVLIGFASEKYLVHPNKIMQHVVKKTGIVIGGRLETFGGIIPFEKPVKNPIIDNKLFLTGDSIPIVKPYTGGGLQFISIAAPVLGSSLDKDDPSIFQKIFRALERRIGLEYYATKIAKKIGYWIPPHMVSYMYKLGLLKHSDYDNHYRILFKSIPYIPWILFREVFT